VSSRSWFLHELVGRHSVCQHTYLVTDALDVDVSKTPQGWPRNVDRSVMALEFDLAGQFELPTVTSRRPCHPAALQAALKLPPHQSMLHVPAPSCITQWMVRLLLVSAQTDRFCRSGFGKHRRCAPFRRTSFFSTLPPMFTTSWCLDLQAKWLLQLVRRCWPSAKRFSA
jgi:hypothetical protein